MNYDPSQSEFQDETPLQRELKKQRSLVGAKFNFGRGCSTEINGWLILGYPGNGMTILKHKETMFTLMMSLN